MSRYIVISMVLIFGLGIGSFVPAVTSWWYDINRAGITSNPIDAETIGYRAQGRILFPRRHHYTVFPASISDVTTNMLD